MSDNPRTMPAAPPNDAIPDARLLARELRHVVNRGAWASALDPAELPGLLALACVAGPAQESGISAQAQLVIVLEDVLKPKKESNDNEPPDQHPRTSRALALLLGLVSTQGKDSVTRRTRAKNYLYDDFMPLGTFNRRRVEPLLNQLADELVKYDRKYRMRNTHERLAAKLPASPALAVMWLDRFHYYYRIWSDLSGLANDLTVYLQARHDPATANTQLERRRRTSLWFLARFFLHLDQFVDQRGGLWLLSDEEQAQLVADSVYLLGFHPPFTEHDVSWAELRGLGATCTGLPPL